MAILKKIKSKIKSLFTKEYRNIENEELLEKYGNRKRCYILGSSTSINDLKLSNLQDGLIISMSNFHEHSDINQINPDIHVFSASHPPLTPSVLENWWSRSNDLLPLRTTVLLEKRDLISANKIFKNRKFYSYSYGGNFPIDFTKNIKSPGSVAQVALQLAIYLNIKEINLIGINHDWQRLKPYRHFYSHDKPSLEYYLYNEGIKIHYEEKKDHLPKEFLYSDYNLYMTYEKFKEYAESKGIQIYNIDPFSTFDVFQKKEEKKIC